MTPVWRLHCADRTRAWLAVAWRVQEQVATLPKEDLAKLAFALRAHGGDAVANTTPGVRKTRTLPDRSPCMSEMLMKFSFRGQDDSLKAIEEAWNPSFRNRSWNKAYEKKTELGARTPAGAHGEGRVLVVCWCFTPASILPRCPYLGCLDDLTALACFHVTSQVRDGQGAAAARAA